MRNDSEDLIRIDLTTKQKSVVKAATDKDADALLLSIHELEQRIAPKLAANHNETVLVDEI
jgi:hypothetical protein